MVVSMKCSMMQEEENSSIEWLWNSTEEGKGKETFKHKQQHYFYGGTIIRRSVTFHDVTIAWFC